MIFELNQVDFKKILPFYSEVEIIFPLILAVLEQKQSGWVFVDDPINPVFALIITKSGFLQMVSAGGNNDFETDVINFFKSPYPYIPTYLLWYAPPLSFQEILDAGSVRRRDRARFILKEKSIETHPESPKGFEVGILDQDSVEKTRDLNLDIGSRFWKSQEDFIENGIGVCVMKDGEIVSLCYSACVAGGLAEVDVFTRDDHRGKGLAVVAAQFFISECLKRGINPTWDCFVYNTASMKLASHLGFTQTIVYPFYSFNVPAKF